MYYREIYEIFSAIHRSYKNELGCIAALFRDAHISNWSEKTHRLTDCYRVKQNFNLYWFVT